MVNVIPAAFICKSIQRFPISHFSVETSCKRRRLLYSFDVRLVSGVSDADTGCNIRRLIERSCEEEAADSVKGKSSAFLCLQEGPSPTEVRACHSSPRIRSRSAAFISLAIPSLLLSSSISFSG